MSSSDSYQGKLTFYTTSASKSPHLCGNPHKTGYPQKMRKSGDFRNFVNLQKISSGNWTISTEIKGYNYGTGLSEFRGCGNITFFPRSEKNSRSTENHFSASIVFRLLWHSFMVVYVIVFSAVFCRPVKTSSFRRLWCWLSAVMTSLFELWRLFLFCWQFLLKCSQMLLSYWQLGHSTRMSTWKTAKMR